MNSKTGFRCKCEPCPLDMDAYGFATEWEDPLFRGKQCLWHKHIVGVHGYISPDIDNGLPAIFVQLKDDSFTAPLSELRRWAKRIGAKRKDLYFRSTRSTDHFFQKTNVLSAFNAD